MNVGIIGAGITGLTAAYDLTRHGHTVTIYESRTYPGGLAAGFRAEGWDWALDRFYHHWFASDSHILGLIDGKPTRDLCPVVIEPVGIFITRGNRIGCKQQ